MHKSNKIVIKSTTERRPPSTWFRPIYRHFSHVIFLDHVCKFLGFFKKFKKIADVETTVLHVIWEAKTERESVLYTHFRYSSEYNVVPLNERWSDWISYADGEKGLVAQVGRPDLDYWDFGDFFHFVNMANNKIIKIPVRLLARQKMVSSSFQKGMVLYLRPTL